MRFLQPMHPGQLREFYRVVSDVTSRRSALDLCVLREGPPGTGGGRPGGGGGSGGGGGGDDGDDGDGDDGDGDGPTHRVARCARTLDTEYGRYVPEHPNVLAEKIVDGMIVESTQRGFFPAVGYEAQAAAFAAFYVFSRLPGKPPPALPQYVPSDVREDPIQGACRYEITVETFWSMYTGPYVSQERYDTVMDRMLTTVNTRFPWNVYHAIVRNSIKWGKEVLR